MGIIGSTPQRSRRSSSSCSFRRQSSIISEISKKIDEKECVFIAMQGEVDRAITDHNQAAMQSLASEIAAHIMDLNQLKQMQLPSSERGRSQRVAYNFEMSLAKLKSILNSDTVAMRKIRDASPETATFYTNNIDPDIVSDIMRFEGNDSRASSHSTLPALAEYGSPVDQSSASQNNSLYVHPAETVEDILDSVESEFGVLQDHLQRPIDDINQYYQLDKGVFYLQVRLKNIEVSQGSPLNERKFALLKQLAEFRAYLDQKSGELEEQRDIIQEINTLELLVDSATENELEGIKSRALIFQETIENTSWDQHLREKKFELLKRLANVLERVGSLVSPAVSLRNNGEHVYGNLKSLQAEIDKSYSQEELECIQSIDRVLENEDEEAIYGNIEVFRNKIPHPNVSSRVQRASSNRSQRGTVYMNADIVRQNSEFEGCSSVPTENAQKIQDIINKRPLPLPRNYDEKMVNDLPKNWQRLNEILDSEYVSETDKLEVAEIQRHAEVARNLFERKIKKIMDKFEESIEL